MDSRNLQNIDLLAKVIDAEKILTPLDVARILSLYIKLFNDKGVVSNISKAYIENYDGKSFYRKFTRQFDRLYEMFLKNGMGEDDKRWIFKKVAKRVSSIPKNVKAMDLLFNSIIEETRSRLNAKSTLSTRKKIIDRFKNAIRKYLHLTWELGFNEPSACARYLAMHHKIDKYIMSGDFPVILLPFLPEIEDEIRKSYENYDMQDSWEILKGRYFNHKADFQIKALEIKSNFTRNIANFSDYFDKIYIDSYHSYMLGKNREKQ